MPCQHSPRLSCVLVGVLAAAGLVLTVASCTGQITPLGPDAAPVMPPSRQLGSPIIVQVMRSQSATATGGCPAGWAAISLPAGGGPHHSAVQAVPVGSPVHVVPNGASGSPAPPPPSTSPAPPPPSAATAPTACYRPAGRPVTITSAAVSSVLTYRPPGQAKGPDLYGFIVAVPGAEVAAVTAVIRQAYRSGGVVGISVAGKLWEAPQVRNPFPGRHLEITLLSRNQALRLHRILVPSG